jgi:predicted Zn-dependent protease
LWEESLAKVSFSVGVSDTGRGVRREGGTGGRGEYLDDFLRIERKSRRLSER